MVALIATTALGTAQVQAQAPTRQQTQTPIYGSELMTDAERLAYHNKMRNSKTKTEKEAFRQEHHEQMKVRAAEKGVTLPDAPMMNKAHKGQSTSGMGQGSAGSSGAGGGAGGK